MKAQIERIALDIDGTLLNSEGIIPKANCAAIRRVREKGARVVLVTGRAFPLAIGERAKRVAPSDDEAGVGLSSVSH